MRKHGVAIALFLLLTLFAVPAFAQEKKVGLVMGYPTLVGVHWQAAKRVGVRVDGAIDFNSTKSTTPSSTTGGITIPSLQFESSSRLASVGVAVLFSLAEKDQLTWYAAPRIAWISITTESTPTVRLVIPGQAAQPQGKESQTNSGVEFDGVIGARYRFTDRFAVFGEAGVVYSDRAVGLIGTADIDAYQVGLKTHLGLVIYF